MTPERKDIRVAVIGGGVVGLTAALECRRAGLDVVLIEPDEPGGRQAASYGNGTWINPGAVMPLSVPGLWRDVPGYLLDRGSPFTIRWRHLPALAPWLFRFVRAGDTWDKVEACARARYLLNRGAVEAHAAYAAEAGVPHLLNRDDVVFVYGRRGDYEGEARGWAIRRALGIPFSEIGEEELRALEPALGPDYRFAIRMDGAGNLRDPGAYCAALAALLERRGAERVRARADGFLLDGGRLKAVSTSRGPVACERALLCAGAYSGPLARQAGDAVPLISERGYHVVIPEPVPALRHSLMPYDGKMAVATTPAGLRLAGQVELASLSAAPDWRRADILIDHAERLFPGLGKVDREKVDRWMGHRPSTPDGLPYIGPSSGSPDIFHGFGHAHVGMIEAPATARILAALAGGGRPEIDPAPFSARRFA